MPAEDDTISEPIMFSVRWKELSVNVSSTVNAGGNASLNAEAHSATSTGKRASSVRSNPTDLARMTNISISPWVVY